MSIKQTQTPVRILQITDSHLFRDPTSALLRLNTQYSFEKVLELVDTRESQIDIVLATGDIAQDASVEAYLRFGRAMDALGAPFYWIPGNHDCRATMGKVPSYEKACTRLIKIGNWQIIMLDSSVTGEVYGYLPENELINLENSLLASADDPTISHTMVCLHHNPVPGTARWMQDIGLHNQDKFLKIVDRFNSVRAVVYGHIHQELDFLRNDVRYFCTPSTCIQFKPAVTDFALDDINPAYRWFDLHRDGTISSAVERVAGFFEVDHSSTGY